MSRAAATKRFVRISRRKNVVRRTERIFDFGGFVGVERLALALVVLGSNSELVVFALFQLGNAELVHVWTHRVRERLPLAGLCVHLLDDVAAEQACQSRTVNRTFV